MRVPRRELLSPANPVATASGSVFVLAPMDTGLEGIIISEAKALACGTTNTEPGVVTTG